MVCTVLQGGSAHQIRGYDDDSFIHTLALLFRKYGAPTPARKVAHGVAARPMLFCLVDPTLAIPRCTSILQVLKTWIGRIRQMLAM